MPDPFKLRGPSQENLFLDLVQRLNRHRSGRTAVHLHLSELSKAYTRDRYLRIALESFSSFVSGMEGQLFTLDNGDIIFVAKDISEANLESVVNRVRVLFSQDPLLEKHTLTGESAFCSWYFVQKDYDSLLTLARDLVKKAEAKQTQDFLTPASLLRPIDPIAPVVLTKLEQMLDTVDVTNISRRQSVCTIVDETGPQTLFEEIFVSIEDLQQNLLPGVNLNANVWLFQYLTHTLDKRIMSMLIRDGVATTRPFSINLNVATILTPEFKRFEDIITPQLKGRLVIELNRLDVFSDMSAFMFARDYLHDHGFRLCLDGMTHHTLPYYDRTRLGFDLVKLYWTPSALDTILPSQMPEIRNIVMDSGQAHTILCRCDDERAIETGQSLGIIMFQGRHIDRLLATTRTTMSPPNEPKKFRI